MTVAKEGLLITLGSRIPKTEQALFQRWKFQFLQSFCASPKNIVLAAMHTMQDVLNDMAADKAAPSCWHTHAMSRLSWVDAFVVLQPYPHGRIPTLSLGRDPNHGRMRISYAEALKARHQAGEAAPGAPAAQAPMNSKPTTTTKRAARTVTGQQVQGLWWERHLSAWATTQPVQGLWRERHL